MEGGARERWREGERGRSRRRGRGREENRERERILGFYVLHDDVTPYNEIMNSSPMLGINGFLLESDKEAKICF